MCEGIDEELLETCGENAIDLAISNVKVGGLPFSAVIVNQNGEVVGKGVNQVAKHLDCTAHAEIQAIRAASRNEKCVSVTGATLIASGEPCALCYMAIRMAGITNVRILSDRYEAENNGFDYLWTYQYLNPGLIDELDVVTLVNDRKLLPFQMAQMNLSD
ncbi:nucleoside deaminase [Marinobacter sp. F3R08]|uniref:nucleoside deaminase n=1 Tax=Marinobacter sp. F3R08 TaxID=2841559 RepID=UPI001C0A569B|nr:nucleoside deaminase [Marinobacter sp. F3R08]MBU2952601.1 nucleoside deaminase [Marinobacter sp. F3R08]